MHLLQIIRKYTLKDTDVKPDTFIADLVIDVPPGQCDKAYAYMSDLTEYGIVVYSWEKNDSWRINHHFFHFDPLNSNVDFKNRSSVIPAPPGAFASEDRVEFPPAKIVSSLHTFRFSRSIGRWLQCQRLQLPVVRRCLWTVSVADPFGRL